METTEIPKNESPRSESVSRMRSWIENGNWKHGERVPSEQKLCQDLGVSRRTIRAALSDLESLSLIVSEKFKGRKINYPERRGDSLLSDTILLLTNQNKCPVIGERTGHLFSIDSGVFGKICESDKNLMILNPFPDKETIEKRITANPPAGVIATSTVSEDKDFTSLFQALSLQHVPLVVNSNNTAHRSLDRVCFDHEKGASELVQALIKSGCRRILYFGPSTSQKNWQERRFKGYINAVRQHGLSPMHPSFYEEPPLEKANDRRAFEVNVRRFAGFYTEFLTAPNRPDAIMAMNDTDAHYSASVCRLFGLTPGKDILITGYDNCEGVPHMFHEFEPIGPSFTVDKNNYECGEKLAEVLLSRLNGEADTNPIEIRTAPKLITLKQSVYGISK